MKSKCNLCGKWITLVHKTKGNPIGRLREHKDRTGRRCWGSAIITSHIR